MYLLVAGVGEIPDYGVHKKIHFRSNLFGFPCNKPSNCYTICLNMMQPGMFSVKFQV